MPIVRDPGRRPGRRRGHQCDTSTTPDQGTTSGSQSHPSNFNQANLALAAATARATLLRLGAARLGVPVGRLRIRDGVISTSTDPDRGVGYGELVRGERFNVPLDDAAERRSSHAWTVLGTSVPRLDRTAAVAGASSEHVCARELHR